MTDEQVDNCPECGSSDLIKNGDELVCEACGLRFGTGAQTEDDEADLETDIEWKAFNTDKPTEATSGQDDSTNNSTDWQRRFQEQREERERQREAQKVEREKQRAALEAAPTASLSWKSDERRLVGASDDTAVLYDEGSIYGIQIQSGEEIWEQTVPTLTDSFSQDISLLSASFFKWRVILGKDSLYVRFPSGEIESRSLATGETQWKCTPEFEHSGRLVIADESIYLTNDGGAMMSLSLTDGTTEWMSGSEIQDGDWQSWFPVPPILLGKYVVSATNSDDGLIIARNHHTGEVEWKFAMRETPSTLLAGQGLVLAGTVRGDAYAINPQDGSQKWRHRLTEFGDREDPSETTRPTEPVRGICISDSSAVITGGGFYSSVVDINDGIQLFELPATGIDQRFGDPDGIFNHPSAVTPNGAVFTFSDSVIQKYDFDTADSIEDARQWSFKATDTIRATPSLWENYLITTDKRERVCLLDIESGEPAFTHHLDAPIQKFVTAQNQILLDTKTAVYSIHTK